MECGIELFRIAWKPNGKLLLSVIAFEQSSLEFALQQNHNANVRVCIASKSSKIGLHYLDFAQRQNAAQETFIEEGRIQRNRTLLPGAQTAKPAGSDHEFSSS